MTPILALFKSTLRSWISAKGFWLVVAVALLPLVLTGAWVGAHRADVAVSELRFDESALVEGQPVTFTATLTNVGATAVDAFNSTIVVGDVQGVSLFPIASSTNASDALQPGESREITLEWTATAGMHYALVRADLDDDLAERDEFNNDNGRPIVVRHATPDPSAAPRAPAGLAGDANSTSEAALSVRLVRDASGLRPGDNATFRMEVTNNGPERVENADAVVRVARSFAGRSVAVVEERRNVTLDAGASETLSVDWTAQVGSFFHEGWAGVPPAMRDPDATDNHRAESVLVDAEIPEGFTPPEVPEKQTIKVFYLSVLGLLHLTILLPLVALFYAAGVVADDRERGSLLYMLTRPLPRWLIPPAKFAAGFLAAAAATVVGLVLTYLLLFGTTTEGGDIGFLTTPILISLLCLFVYGAAFTLLGTLIGRPYLIGLVFVLFWEVIVVLLPRLVTQSGARPFEFIDPVLNYTIAYHVNNAFAGWPLDAGVTWLPEGADALRAVMVVAGIAVVSLVLASLAMKRREFEV